MNPSILSIVSEVAEHSSEVRLISNRIHDATISATTFARSMSTSQEQSEDPTIADLLVEIGNMRDRATLLNQRIMELIEALDEANDVTISDGQIVRFKQDFMARVGSTKTNQLMSAYDVAYFRSLPKTLRPLVAQCLIQIFDERKNKPLDLWQKLSLSDGAL